MMTRFLLQDGSCSRVPLMENTMFNNSYKDFDIEYANKI